MPIIAPRQQNFLDFQKIL